MTQEMVLTLSDMMHVAAKSVATTHHHYMEHCCLMHRLKGKPDAMAHTLKQRKDAHAAYHVALAFLKVATMKANPQLDLSRNKQVNWKDRPALQERMNQWADGQLNRLIQQQLAASFPEATSAQHAVIMMPLEVKWK